MTLYTGGAGIPLKDIITQLGDKNYPTIMCRCLYEWEDEEQDDLFGYCSYVDGELESLDCDSYSLNDLYIKWEEDGDMLIVWEQGVMTNE